MCFYILSILCIISCYIWDSFRENGSSFIIIKSSTLHLNRNNFRMVKAIDFLYSTLHTTSFL